MSVLKYRERPGPHKSSVPNCPQNVSRLSTMDQIYVYLSSSHFHINTQSVSRIFSCPIIVVIPPELQSKPMRGICHVQSEYSQKVEPKFYRPQCAIMHHPQLTAFVTAAAVAHGPSCTRVLSEPSFRGFICQHAVAI